MHHVTPLQIQNAVWLVIVLTASTTSFIGLLWMIWLVRAFRRDKNRVRDGLCMRCGYDLRSSESRCPECGEPIWKK